MDGSLAAAVVGLVAHGLAEPLMRHREARSIAATEFDRGTTLLVSATAAAAVLLAFAVRAAGLALGPAPGTAASALLALLVFAGAGLRYWSMATLGRHFTRTLRVAEDQAVVRAGPYRLVRHPGYLSNLLVYGAAGALVTRSWLYGAAALLSLGLAYAHRIHHEERMLVGALGERYRAYQRETRRLVPGLY